MIHVLCVCVCVCMCVCVCIQNNSINNGSIHFKLEHVVVNGNSFYEFNIRQCPIKVKVTA